MKFKKIKLSIIIPIHNDSAEFIKNYKKLIAYLELNALLSKFEIIIGDNGSILKESRIVSKICKKNNIRYFYTRTKGIGAGLKLAFLKSKYDYIFFCGIDFPFGFEIIDYSIKSYLNAFSENEVLVIGSKGHLNSKINVPFKRKIFSGAFNFFINTFFNIHIKDTQGTLFFSRVFYRDIKSRLTSNTAFLQTQICIYAKKKKYSVIEIPVMYKEYRSNSKVNLLNDSFSILTEAIKEMRVK